MSMKFSELPIKDRVITSCILFCLWLVGTFAGCAIGIYFFKQELANEF